MKRKFFSILTALALCLSLCPVGVLAAEDTVSDASSLLAAVDRANNGEAVSVQLGADINVNGNRLKLTGGSLTLDLNGHELSGNANGPSGADGLFHVDGGSLTLVGSGKVINKIENPTITMTSGSIVINGGMTISRTSSYKKSINATGGSLKV